MSIDDGQPAYDDDSLSGRPGEGRRTLIWVAGVTLALASLIVGVLIGNARSGNDRNDTPAVAASADSGESSPAQEESPSDAEPSLSTSSAAPSAEASPAGTASASPSPSVSPSPSASASATGQATASAAPSTSASAPAPAAVLAAATPAGDIVLVDSETAAIGRTLIKNADLPTGEGAAGEPVSVSWHAASETVYVARGCSVLRHRVKDGSTERIAAGRLAAVSPDGGRVAVWTCREGSVGDLAVVDSGTGEVGQSLPVTTTATEEGGGMNYLSSIDWRADGRALVVTAGWEGDDIQHVINLTKLPKSVVVAPRLPLSGVDGSYHSTEYVGQRLVMYGTCCPPDEGTSFVVVRDGKTGALTKVPALSGIGFIDPTADAKGRLRFLKPSESDGPGAMWALDTLAGTPREIGGEFTAVDW